MAATYRSRIIASAFAVALSLGSVGLSHAAADPTAVAAKREPVIVSPNQPDPGTLIIRADLQTTFLSHGSNGNTTVDMYRVKNNGPAPAQSVSLEKVCIFKSQGGGGTNSISTQTSQVNVGNIASGGQVAHSVSCTAPQGKYVYGSTLRATSSTQDPNMNNNHATSN